MSKAGDAKVAAVQAAGTPPAFAPTDRGDGSGAASAGSLLFGQVTAQSPANAVVRRLRAAIALGLLGDGDRLPREADLAQRLGVTMFSVREALGILRGDGLITTRPGKNGGSFVSYGTDRSLLSSTQLMRMSATELRDLCDWRQMLASASAALAAQRASDSNIVRLRRQVEKLARAEGELEGRRAHGRFHIELAAAAQSTRMTRGELELYEEFDWLLGGALADEEGRRKAVDELTEIVTAVGRRDHDGARAACDAHTASTTEALVMLRLEAIASQADAAAVEGRSIVEQLAHIVGSVFRSLDLLASQAGNLVPRLQSEDEMRAQLSRAALAAAADIELDGLGYIAEPGVIPGSKYAMAWWHLTPDGMTIDDSHVLDPDRDDFYDYTTYEYFTVPKQTLGPHAQGPYVDYGGTNDYSITFSRPVIRDGRFLGIAAADVPVANIEWQLAPWLASGDSSCVVINSERRVIVANTVANTVGEVLSADRGEGEPVGPIGWSVVR
ncbi:MAG: FCD domain-containing protein [Actinobacteria bacterium]|nr:FCD domain-containing protein [Actinomycetota bacterium]